MSDSTVPSSSVTPSRPVINPGVFCLHIADDSAPIPPGVIATFERVHRAEDIKFNEPIYIRLNDGRALFTRIVGASPGYFVLRTKPTDGDTLLLTSLVEYFGRFLGTYRTVDWRNRRGFMS